MFVIMKKSKYEVEKLIAKQRIEKLEHMVCPDGHDYKKISYLHGACICSRCGKISKEEQ